MDESSSQFMEQFTGSASANIVTVLLLGVLMVLKRCVERNKHSECKSGCCSFEVDNQTVRSRTNAVEESESEKKPEEV